MKSAIKRYLSVPKWYLSCPEIASRGWSVFEFNAFCGHHAVLPRFLWLKCIPVGFTHTTARTAATTVTAATTATTATTATSAAATSKSPSATMSNSKPSAISGCNGKVRNTSSGETRGGNANIGNQTSTRAGNMPTYSMWLRPRYSALKFSSVHYILTLIHDRMPWPPPPHTPASCLHVHTEKKSLQKIWAERRNKAYLRGHNDFCVVGVLSSSFQY